eukprot:4936013-Pleurochrysis_carterae.AAC.1
MFVEDASEYVIDSHAAGSQRCSWSIDVISAVVDSCVPCCEFRQDKIWQFVDLLAVANVSCFVLVEPLFGYYLHGRSVHPHADTDMLQLNLQVWARARKWDGGGMRELVGLVGEGRGRRG